jgi:hypothetical protein
MIEFVVRDLFSGKSGFGSQQIQLMVTFVTALVFGLGLLMFVITHWKFVLGNSGTIDSFGEIEPLPPNGNYFEDARSERVSPGDRAPRVRANGNPFDIGKRRNFEQIFGQHPFWWFFPVYSTLGDGIRWEIVTEQDSLLV